MPFDLKAISRMVRHEYSTFRRWVRNVMCRIDSDAVQEELHGNDLQRAYGTVEVPVFQPEAVGRVMSIDEKCISGEYYTVMTNTETGEAALIASCCDSGALVHLLRRMGDDVTGRVRAVTRDLSGCYESVIDNIFPEAEQVADKFHVIKMLFDHLQGMRTKLLRSAQAEQAEAMRMHREAYRRDRARPEKARLGIPKAYRPRTLPNGETVPAALSRSRYLLFKYNADWTVKQYMRAKALFRLFPALRDAYYHVCDFRSWYTPITGDPDMRSTRERQLLQWCNAVSSDSALSLLRPFVKTVMSNISAILSYFPNLYTNARAESTNAIIQNAVHKNRGTRDPDFFFFRLSHFLLPSSSTSK